MTGGNQMRKLITTAVCACLAMTAMAADTDIPGTGGVPDLTKGGQLTRINKRWAGPIGVYCGSWRPRGQKMEDVRQLLVMEVEKGSPADGVLEFGDVILGADGTGAKTVPPFTGANWAMTPIANAITEAEAHDPALLNLLVWRPAIKPQAPATDAKTKAPAPEIDLDNLSSGAGGKDDDDKPFIMPKTNAAGGKVEGKVIAVTVKLEYLGRYSDTAPYNCEKSKNILRSGIKKLYEDNKPDKVGFAMLCLLAADDPTNPDNDKYQARAKEWAHQIEDGGNAWISGGRLISLSEYYMKTRDETIFPKLVKQAETHASGVSWFGTTGHRWADSRDDGSPRGRMSGYGPIGACGVQGLLGLSLARKAGVKSAIVEAANKDQRIFFGHYAFRGAPSYGEFTYSIGGEPGDNNGKCAMTALALGMEENQDANAKYFTKMTTLSPASDRVYCHGGSFFSQVWNPIGAAQGGVKTANLHLQEIRWHLDLNRRWNHTRIYDGSGNSYDPFAKDATGLLFYAMPLKQLYITGRGQKESLKLSDAEFENLLACKNFDAKALTSEKLIAALSDFDTMRRGAAGGELAERITAKPEAPESAAIIDQLIALASDSKASIHGRAGACLALTVTKENSKIPAVTELKNAEIAKAMVGLLKDQDPYIWYSGTKVLQAIDTNAVRPYLNDILDAAVAHARPSFPLTEDDPLQASQVRLAQLLCEKLLKDSLDGVDREKLLPAVKVLLDQPHANGRNAASKVLDKLAVEDILRLGNVVVENVIHRPPANAMGGTEALYKSQAVLTKHLFEEALPLSVTYACGEAVKNKMPQKYGLAAFSMKSSDHIIKTLCDKMLAEASIDANSIIAELQKTPAPENMLKMKTIHSVKASEPTITLPAVKTELVADATNYALPAEQDTIYTWRKVYGAGKVVFTPNGSGQSRKTTVSFTDQKPGKYRFEVTMSDTLGYTEASKTTDVILYDKSGKLPANRPPQAKSLAFTVEPGRPGLVQLSGTDPDGDDLGFAVTQQPAHGKLSGVGGNLIYTAQYGFNGTDQFTFNAIDGQGEAASGTIQFKVSDKDVGVAVYEGFDYPTGSIHDKASETSFGFSGPWANSRQADGYQVERKGEEKQASLSYPGLPSTGGVFVQGQGHTTCSRPLDTQLLKKLKMLEPGGEMWFSFFFTDLIPRSITFAAGTNTNFGVSIVNKNAKSGVYATLTDGTVSERNEWSRSAALRFPKGPNMVIGRCIWGKTDKDPDTMEVYRVLNAPGYGIAVASQPVSIAEGPIPQEQLSSIVLSFSGKAPIDEIRVGPTQHSVMVGTKPLGK